MAQQYPDTDSDRFESVTSLHEEVVGNVRPALLTILAAVFFVLAHRLRERGQPSSRTSHRSPPRNCYPNCARRQSSPNNRAIVGGGTSPCRCWSCGWTSAGIVGYRLSQELRTAGCAAARRYYRQHAGDSIHMCHGGCQHLLFALIPALQVTRPNLNPSLQDGSRGGSGHESHRLRALLVVSQVALSLLLLIGAGLLIRSFANLRATSPGFDPSHAVTIQLVLPRAKYPDTEQHRRFFEEILPKLAALPGIEAVGAANPLPFSGNDRGSTFSVAGEPLAPPGKRPAASHLIINTDYFRAMKIPRDPRPNFQSARHERFCARYHRQRRIRATIYPWRSHGTTCEGGRLRVRCALPGGRRFGRQCAS